MQNTTTQQNASAQPEPPIPSMSVQKPSRRPEPFEAERLPDPAEKSLADTVSESVTPYGTHNTQSRQNIQNIHNTQNVQGSQDTQQTAKPAEQMNLFEDKLLDVNHKQDYRIIGQLFDTYWLIEFEDSFYMMDQHAAHEKILYERLKMCIRDSFKMAEDIIFNAKTQRIGVCNACESLVVHSKIAGEFIPQLVDRLKLKNVEIRGDERAMAADSRIVPATEEDWGTEYLDYIISLKVVDSIDEAIAHINRYNTGHSEAIITKDYDHAQQFLNEIDAAAVYVLSLIHI